MDYGIAFHFAATCFKIEPTPRLRKAEIIEFYAVLFEFKTGKIEAEFHKFVKPEEKPQLSKFCIELTKISQHNVDNGIVLAEVLKLFDEWLRKELTSRCLKLPELSFVTWTNYEFGIVLDLECKRKGLKKPEYFNKWIDLRADFTKKYKKYGSIKFADAVMRMGLDSEESKSKNAKTLATLAYKMVTDGTTLTLTDN